MLQFWGRVMEHKEKERAVLAFLKMDDEEEALTDAGEMTMASSGDELSDDDLSDDDDDDDDDDLSDDDDDDDDVSLSDDDSEDST